MMLPVLPFAADTMELEKLLIPADTKTELSCVLDDTEQVDREAPVPKKTEPLDE